MKTLAIITATAVALVLASPASASPVKVYSVQGPQDVVFPLGWWEELGIGFPANELISTANQGTTQVTSCHLGPGDSPGIPNAVISMTNLTKRSFYEPWYVADPETTITNYDGWIGNAALGDGQFAFMIDNMGVNQPLTGGDVNGNFAFDPGETWTFILQDYVNAAGGPPEALDSIGIASVSAGWPPSTGSIIAIPEPATLSLLGLGGVAVLIRRRRKA